ncbi:FtsX-like permease family protein [Duganella sp. FT134W]|uniref:FtsX-like permease family protein n=1 Tax=Duganella margarita TaxID=2692170 RepID=A0A7X4H874_9BURK|nr:FtsX-like permease family protein [Duganella margarita]MYM76097.1 FtsX-like permease family protein [Duganella margarita]
MDFRIGWRTLVQQPAYTLTVILSLSIGLAASLLLLGFVRYSLEYDTHVPAVDQVYVVKHHFNVEPASPLYDIAPMFLREAALKTPGVADVTSYIPARPEITPLTIRAGRNLMTVRSLIVMPGFPALLGMRALQGDLASALERPDRFIITDAAALRLFGTRTALGRSITSEGHVMQVGAVVQAPPANTTIPFELLFGVNGAVVEPEIRHEMLTGEHGWMTKMLLRLTPGASLPAILQRLQQAVDSAPSLNQFPPEVRERLGKRKAVELSISPLRDAYFDDKVENSFIALPGDRASPRLVFGLALLAALILLLAAINYVNLTTVRVLRRQREMAMRKVLGAGVPQIMLQFLLESVLVALAATALGLLLAWLALPVFSQLVNRQLDGLFAPSNIVAAFGIGALLGAVTAGYPAWIALRVHPTQVLAGRPETETRGSLQWRRALTVLQIGAAMGLAGVTIAVAWQTDYANSAAPGFDPAPIVVVDMPGHVRATDKARQFFSALQSQPGVAGVAISEDPVGRLDWSWTRMLKRPGGESASMEMKAVSANFFELYGIAPAAGRLFQAGVDKENDAGSMVLNAVAARALGFASAEQAVGQIVSFTGFDNAVISARVVGIAPELRFHSLRDQPRATAYALGTAGMVLSARATGAPADVERAAQALWPSYFPDAIPKIYRAGEVLKQHYAEDARMARLLAVATGIALAIAAFGTYALSANTIQRRAREIILRKLHGAQRADVGLLMLREIGTLILAAGVIGLPIAAVAVQRYLSGYVDHAPIGYWTLLVALALTMLIAVGAISRHTWLAMRLSPAEALRS